VPPGRYTINASKGGKSQQRDIVVGAGARPTVKFSFPE
jgi:hypothetical protein